MQIAQLINYVNTNWSNHHPLTITWLKACLTSCNVTPAIPPAGNQLSIMYVKWQASMVQEIMSVV